MNILVFKTVTLKINGIILVLSLLVFGLLIKLGLWQWERADEKELRLQQMLEYEQQASLSLSDVLQMMTIENHAEPETDLRSAGSFNADKLNDLPVKLFGRFGAETFLLDNKVNRGRSGYQVIKVFRDDISHDSVLVNLGWVEGSIDRSQLPRIDDMDGKREFSGKIRIIDPSFVLEDEALDSQVWPQRIQAVDTAKISRLLGKQLLPFVVYVDNDETLGFVKEWVPIVMPPEKHRAYAFQWFSLAAAWVILLLVAAYKASEENHKQRINLTK